VRVIPTAIKDLLLLEPNVFGDERGFFMETYNKQTFRQATGLDVEFVQDNHSRSTRGVLRGLHYQIKQPQGKLVRVVTGEVFDVAVDLRRNSPTLGKWVGVRLSAESPRMAWIPPGFAHGFLVLSDRADFLYKATDFYAPQHERTLLWNDADVGVEWPLETSPILTQKDLRGGVFARAELF
jgi:dTDP-4-dehydrorhamnose 3,5-epimerase